MITVYGTMDSNTGAHIDTSTTLLGAKQWATRNNYYIVTKRVGYNSTIVASKLRGKWQNEKPTINDVEIYDNGDITIDRITFVFKNTPCKDTFETRFLTYKCLCTSYDGVSFWQHSHCQVGRHLGEKVKFENLNKELQHKFEKYLLEY